MSEENQSGFKVTDRRLFNPDGSMREDAQIPEPPPAVQPTAQSNLSAISELPPQEQFPADEEDVIPEQTMFTDFVMNIASSAFIYLGLVEHPATGRRQVDMMAAKETIDLLMMLREKTSGNLSRGEERFFDELLADLKTQFVSMRRQ
ncbi:MAG: DUF1844 domain-containing protein [Acidobacteriota bacterium]|nr:DUF1844 domain-containing protein [Acidobacteriota bacterium]